MPSTTINYFKFEHLPDDLQAVAKPIAELASRMEATLLDGPEKSAGMRKLLEAKDCFVRTALDMRAAFDMRNVKKDIVAPAPDWVKWPRLVEIVKRYALIADDADVTPTTTLASLDIESLAAVEFIMAIEDEFAVEISDEDAEKFKTLDDVERYLHAKK